MTAVALDREASSSEFTSEEFLQALSRVLPGSHPSSARSVALVALLDDGSLATVAVLGTEPRDPCQGLLWADEDWTALSQYVNEHPRPLEARDRTLFPVMMGPVLYGAIDWQGTVPVESLREDVAQLLAEEFLAPLINRIGG